MGSFVASFVIGVGLSPPSPATVYAVFSGIVLCPGSLDPSWVGGSVDLVRYGLYGL